MVISRAIFCYFAGVLVLAAPKVIEETVPNYLIDYGFGSSTGAVINLQVMITMLIGFGYPTIIEERNKSNWWLAFYLAPVPFLVIALIQNFFEHRQDGLLFHI